ncbi:cobyrinate a,c-diamide synthase [Herbivorax sp. ANBcel31]|uniref:cobyrinate a,c-diamide synthase n=1 Tax=Herbivorax sp. ANBcel31 TaxID=3069754 RepID=UPI0027B4A8E4|nr:cobyrinate a,c-diamide synthase [Herbivorax sp. ANBcel31]MDQ2086965.1 cobyrinate a,c-diamide synthase [Herbivorax sp. ANBcel31]
MSIKSIMIAGTNSGCGKTTISIGIMAALCNMGIDVQPFKVGPDYIDPKFHKFITGKHSENLDSWLLEEEALLYIYKKNAKKAQMSVIEGVMGLYDGFGGNTKEGSTAHVSRIIKAPVILVVNGRGASLSIVPIIKGFIDFDRDVDIKGVIINNVNSDTHYNLLKSDIEKYTGIHVLGYIPKDASYSLEQRHLGLVPQMEIKDIKTRVEKLASQVKKTIDIELLLKIAGESNISCSYETDFLLDKKFQKIKIAVANDRAFNFYYRENIEILKKMGAEIIYFSPIEDGNLPEDVDGLYIGGGYPEIFAGELEENKCMRYSIKDYILKGLPAYAECGGLMYMAKSLVASNDKEFEMAGVIPKNCEMIGKLKRFGYVNIEVLKDNVLSSSGDKIRAHEFHYSALNLSSSTDACYKVIKNRYNMEPVFWECGYRVKNLLAAYQHIHFLSNLDFAFKFIKSCTSYSKYKGIYNK